MLTTPVAPNSAALLIATVDLRSLNERVGFRLSSLTYTRSRPIASATLDALTRGVSPSPRVTTGVPGFFGSRGEYLQTPAWLWSTGRPPWAFLRASYS